MAEEQKIGAGHASAMLRLGFRELRNAANPSRDSIADTELGLYGSSTPQEVYESRQPGSQPAERAPAEQSSREPQKQQRFSGPELSY